MSNKKIIFVPLLIVMIFGAAGLFMNQLARAVEFSWLTGDPTGRVLTSAGPSGEKCITQKVHIGSPQGEEGNVCVYQANGWRYGIYDRWVSTSSYSGYNQRDYVISIGSDTAMYTIGGIPAAESSVYVANSGNLIYHSYAPGTSYMFNMYIIKDLPSKLERISLGGTPEKIGYQVRPGSAEPLIKNAAGDMMSTYKVQSSENGKWLAVELRPGGFIRINLQTSEMLWFSKFTPTYGQGSDPTIEFAVSDDGKRIATAGQNMGIDVYELNGSCGQTVTNIPDNYLSAPLNECPKRDLYQFANQTRGGNLRWATNPSFDSEAGELTLHTIPNPNSPDMSEKWITLRASGYTPPEQLDYLALGDSFSSGEGDTEVNPVTNTKYYRPFTDNEENQVAGIPREKCHVSTRSYPYQLALDMNFGNPRVGGASGRWQSVACSGAQVGDVQGNNGVYEGQGKDGPTPRLAGYDIPTLKEQALNEFIPGRNEQIEFVKRYRPKVMTLTMGGNDAHFKDVINACVNPSPLQGGEWASSCSYAMAGDKRVAASEQIKDQYSRLKHLYAQLIDISRGGKLYVLGYPQFVNADPSDLQCGSNVRLNHDERIMVREGTAYMNQVIKAAARASGAIYINTENALTGHQLCDNDMKAINGITLLSPGEQQESFHPNALGHRLLAETLELAVNHESLLTYSCIDSLLVVCPNSQDEEPQVPGYFQNGQSNGVLNTLYDSILKLGDTVDKVTSANLLSSEFYFSPNSPLRIFLYSNPTDLGTATATSAGQLDASISIPSTIQAGYHTIEVTGKSYSGEDITVWQIVRVLGTNPNDRDENGVVDSQQACGLFSTASGQDHDQDGIDDACDPQITDPPAPKDPYRLRAGDPTKAYAGSAEQASALYLERNVFAAAKTGISGDYDPDHDGWATVATNQGAGSDQPSLNPYAHFWTDGSDGNIVPHVSFRTKEDGCVQYKPADLSQLTQSNGNAVRTFTQEAMDTNTCRSDPPNADLDNDGQPDNTQPLYLARRGDSAKGEDQTKLYLFRSTRAAEAQIGKSDYVMNDPTITPSAISPIDTKDYRKPWSLLATSPANAYSFSNNFARLKFISNYVYAVTGYTSPFYSQCYAYKPDNLATIKQSTQSTRQLTSDWMIGFNLTLGGKCNEQ